MDEVRQVVTDRYGLYQGDCLEVMPQFPDGSVHFSVYSPPFAGLYHYSSSPRDLSNCRSYDEFMAHYRYVVEELYRLTMPGRMTAVHCMDIPMGNQGNGLDHILDFPGDIIRMHADVGFLHTARHCIWKEPLGVRNRTMAKKLAHATIVEDSTKAGVAGADYLLIFRKKGENPVPVSHPVGLLEYAGERTIPPELLKFRGWQGNQIENEYSHWIWRQYASSFWDDARIDRVLPYQEARDPEDEKHVHPLQLDVIERGVVLYSNPGEVVFTPFMGVGSEVYGAVQNNRFGVGVELKPTYFYQAVKNLETVDIKEPEPVTLFDMSDPALFDGHLAEVKL